jgi:hypothetical protein
VFKPFVWSAAVQPICLLVPQEGVMQANSVWCRVLSFMDKLAGSAVYSLMLLEGIFLHRLIAAAFRGEPNMKYYYLVATGKILPSTAYVCPTVVTDPIKVKSKLRADFCIPFCYVLKLNKIIILPVVLYGRETWTLTLREEHRLSV